MAVISAVNVILPERRLRNQDYLITSIDCSVEYLCWQRWIRVSTAMAAVSRRAYEGPVSTTTDASVIQDISWTGTAAAAPHSHWVSYFMFHPNGRDDKPSPLAIDCYISVQIRQVCVGGPTDACRIGQSVCRQRSIDRLDRWRPHMKKRMARDRLTDRNWRVSVITVA